MVKHLNSIKKVKIDHYIKQINIYTNRNTKKLP